MARLLLSVAVLATLSGVAIGQVALASEITPSGTLRVSMIAITVLGGVAEPVARFIGQKLGVAVQPVMYPSPDAYLQSFGKGQWNIAIGPRVFAPAVKIGTILGAPSDRALTREIKAAEIVRIPLSPNIATDAAELLRSGDRICWTTAAPLPTLIASLKVPTPLTCRLRHPPSFF
jgi:hypothetical protein